MEGHRDSSRGRGAEMWAWKACSQGLLRFNHPQSIVIRNHVPGFCHTPLLFLGLELRAAGGKVSEECC